MHDGDPVVVADGHGREASGRLRGAQVIVEGEQRSPELSPRLHVYQAAAKAGKTDDILEKLGELGIAAFTVFGSERTIARWSLQRSERVTQRWAAIARRVGKQSRRARFVETEAPLAWAQLLERLRSENGIVLVLWEHATRPLRAALPAETARVSLVVGPEGGFSADEVRELEQRGAVTVSLGAGIIRSENAAFLAAALCLSAYGLIG